MIARLPKRGIKKYLRISCVADASPPSTVESRPTSCRPDERLRGNRSRPSELAAALGNRSFDAVVDMTLCNGRDAAGAIDVLAGCTGRYIFNQLGPGIPAARGRAAPSPRVRLRRRVGAAAADRRGRPAVAGVRRGVSRIENNYGPKLFSLP